MEPPKPGTIVDGEQEQSLTKRFTKEPTEEIQKGRLSWNANLCYLDRDDNYYLKSTRKIAPWNDAVKKAFPNKNDFTDRYCKMSTDAEIISADAEVIDAEIINEDVQHILEVPVEEVKVISKPSHPKSSIDTDEFKEAIYKLFINGPPWKTSKFLAEKLNVDVVELDVWLRKQPMVLSRVSSKDESVFLYTLVKEDKEDKEKPEQKEQKPTPVRPLVTEEDKYAIGMCHSALIVLEAALRKYAVPISAKNPEAYTKLIQAREALQAGTILFMQTVKADIRKLPPLPD